MKAVVFLWDSGFRAQGLKVYAVRACVLFKRLNVTRTFLD